MLPELINRRQTQDNNRNQLELEREKYRTQKKLDKEKYQAELISKVIVAENTEQSAQNLLFLIRGGLIDDPEHKIEELAKKGEVAVLSPRAYTSGRYQGIPPEGVGGDPDLNLLRNRDLPPPGGKYEAMTIANILSLQPAHAEDTFNKRRREWSLEALNEIGQWESKGIQVEGYIRRVKLQGPSAAYGRQMRSDSRAIHLVLAGDPEESNSTKTFTAVATPRVSQHHPEWTVSRLLDLAQQKARVRVSGWLIWDRLHAAPLGEITGTSWRITPVLNVEVQDGKRWIPLSGEHASASHTTATTTRPPKAATPTSA